MHLLLAKSLQRLEALVSAAPSARAEMMSALVVSLPPLQEAYEKLLSDSLTLLADGYKDECLHQLQLQRNVLEPYLERVTPVVAKMVDSEDEYLKMVVEYLYTRARLVDEMKMFPEFGLELLKKFSVDDSIEKIIYYLEYAMTGKEGLYPTIMSGFSTRQ